MEIETVIIAYLTYFLLPHEALTLQGPILTLWSKKNKKWGVDLCSKSMLRDCLDFWTKFLFSNENLVIRPIKYPAQHYQKANMTILNLFFKNTKIVMFKMDLLTFWYCL